MRKAIFAFSATAFVLTTLSVTSCKKKDSNDTPTLVGGWEARSIKATVTDVTTTPPTPLFSFDTTFAAGQGNYIQFRSNSSYITRETYSSTGTEDSGTYKLSGNKLILMAVSASEADTINYAISGNVLTLSNDVTDNGEREVTTIILNRR